MNVILSPFTSYNHAEAASLSLLGWTEIRQGFRVLLKVSAHTRLPDPICEPCLSQYAVISFYA